MKTETTEITFKTTVTEDRREAGSYVITVEVVGGFYRTRVVAYVHKHETSTRSYWGWSKQSFDADGERESSPTANAPVQWGRTFDTWGSQRGDASKKAVVTAMTQEVQRLHMRKTYGDPEAARIAP